VSRGRRVVSIIGATGLVGSEIARVLIERRFPFSELRLFASGRKPDTSAEMAGARFPIRPFNLDEVKGSDICFLAAGGGFSRRYARAIASRGVSVIDNSSAFRMDDDVPLVVPEVNPEDIPKHRGIIANPNCSTIQMVVVLAPLHRCWRLQKVVVSTYQGVTGAGLEAGGELAVQASAVLCGEMPRAGVFPHPIAFNLIPHIGAFDDEGFTVEETKLTNETKKIMGDEKITVVATAVRVPVFRGHSEAVHAEFELAADPGLARDLLSSSPGVGVIDDPGKARYPMPRTAAGRDLTYVGRIRRDPSCDRSLCMWIVSDNLRKGAALNAVQIAERLGEIL
jgi:aspartate-semialdehyde dehydrogenase